jgi:sulfite reductase (NADPH) hemoprotein beta-component
VVEFYRAERASPAEKFIDTLERLGHQRFQEALYAAG